MDIDNKKERLPENPSWEKLINLCATLMSENKQYREGWAMEMAAQAKQNAKRWFIAWAITLAAMIATNVAWIYVFQSYEYVSQDGTGFNNINTGKQGDLNNGPEGQN